MVFQKLITLAEGFEDPKNPLLGPTLKGLYSFGLWQTGSKFRTIIFNIFHCSTIVFVLSQITDLYTVRYDINKVLNNISLTALSLVCLAKCFSYVLKQAEWKELVKEISQEELLQKKKQDELILKLMAKYTLYTRVVTYMYWIMVLLTNVLLITTPLIKYLSSKTYRGEIKEGLEPPPHIMSSWLPFNTSKMPGYLIKIVVHVIMGSQGAAVVAVYDTNAVSIMTYLKGQLTILKAKCESIFDEGTREDILERIKECHRHHNALLKHYKMFSALLSPIMFVYVLICSITICCSVIQFSSKEATPSQKIWVIQYTTGQIAQLFIYCWHSNEITIEVSFIVREQATAPAVLLITDLTGMIPRPHIKLVFSNTHSTAFHRSRTLDRGIYDSDWWKGDVALRRQILLLSGKFSHLFVLEAGPYTTLSVPTFIDIIKGSYSFYTLFVQMQDD